jgi:hypothetical protein
MAINHWPPPRLRHMNPRHEMELRLCSRMSRQHRGLLVREWRGHRNERRRRRKLERWWRFHANVEWRQFELERNELRGAVRPVERKLGWVVGRQRHQRCELDGWGRGRGSVRRSRLRKQQTSAGTRRHVGCRPLACRREDRATHDDWWSKASRGVVSGIARKRCRSDPGHLQRRGLSSSGTSQQDPRIREQGRRVQLLP